MKVYYKWLLLLFCYISQTCSSYHFLDQNGAPSQSDKISCRITHYYSACYFIIICDSIEGLELSQSCEINENNGVHHQSLQDFSQYMKNGKCSDFYLNNLERNFRVWVQFYPWFEQTVSLKKRDSEMKFLDIGRKKPPPTLTNNSNVLMKTRLLWGNTTISISASSFKIINQTTAYLAVYLKGSINQKNDTRSYRLLSESVPDLLKKPIYDNLGVYILAVFFTCLLIIIAIGYAVDKNKLTFYEKNEIVLELMDNATKSELRKIFRKRRGELSINLNWSRFKFKKPKRRRQEKLSNNESSQRLLNNSEPNSSNNPAEHTPQDHNDLIRHDTVIEPLVIIDRDLQTPGSPAHSSERKEMAIPESYIDNSNDVSSQASTPQGIELSPKRKKDNSKQNIQNTQDTPTNLIQPLIEIDDAVFFKEIENSSAVKQLPALERVKGIRRGPPKIRATHLHANWKTLADNHYKPIKPSIFNLIKKGKHTMRRHLNEIKHKNKIEYFEKHSPPHLRYTLGMQNCARILFEDIKVSFKTLFL